MRGVLAFVLLVAGAAGCASRPAADPAPAPANGELAAAMLYPRIPRELGAFRLTERTVVRAAPFDSLFRYSDGTRTILSVIIYDVSADLRAKRDSQKWTRREGEKFKMVQDIRVQRGQIAAYQVAFSDAKPMTVAGHELVEHAIAIPTRYPNGGIAVEFQYLYLIAGKFVKVRATVPGDEWQRTQVATFARDLATRLAGGP